MTPEENKRIAQIEILVSDILEMQSSSIKNSMLCQEAFLALTRLVQKTGETNVALLHLIASSPLIADEKERSKILDSITSQETKDERSEAALAAFQSSVKSQNAAMLASINEAIKRLRPGTEPPPPPAT